jgi:colanic acid/amylovoran biosynthesis glycosyltransferase
VTRAHGRVVVFRHDLGRYTEGFVADSVRSFRILEPCLLGLTGNLDRLDLTYRTLNLSHSRRALMGLTGLTSELDRAIVRLDPVAVIAHFAIDGALIAPICLRHRIPLVTILHGFDVSRSTLSFILSARPMLVAYTGRKAELLRSGSLFLAVSDHIRDLALQRGFPADRTDTHYLGVDAPWIRATAQTLPDEGADLGGRSPTIVTVGRLVEKKGTADLMLALSMARGRGSNLRLVIVGDGPMRSQLQRLATKLSLESHVTFCGAVDRPRALGHIASSTILSVPSRTSRSGETEGLPTVVLEGAALERAILATDHGGIAEVIVPQVSGILVPERSPEALADGMLRLESSAALRHDLGREALNRVQRDFDLVRQCQRLEDRLLDLTS